MMDAAEVFRLRFGFSDQDTKEHLTLPKLKTKDNNNEGIYRYKACDLEGSGVEDKSIPSQ